MNLFILLLLLGISLTGFMPQLPHLSHLLLGSVALIVAYLITRAKPINYLLAMLVGVSYVSIYVNIFPTPRLPERFSNVPMIVQGTVTSLPVFRGQRAEFIFKTEFAVKQNMSIPLGLSIKIYWQGAPQDIQVGDTWSIPLKVKCSHSNRNPGSRDSEKYDFLNRISGTGYVTKAARPKRVAQQPWSYPVTFVRQKLANQIMHQLNERPFLGPILAMVIGQTHLIEEESWEILKATGTAHLMAISGLHVGLVAGLGFWLTSLLWRQYLCRYLRVSRQVTSAGVACLFALIYAALAGFSLPTQRAFIMILVGSFSVFFNRWLSLSQLYFLTLLIVLLINPLSVFFPGFWLSFGAVGLIFYALRCRQSGATSFWQRYLYPHWVLFVGLCPFTLLFFKQVAWVSAIANFIAIPWVSLVVVPLALLGALFSPLNTIGGMLLTYAERAFSWLWPYLNGLSKLSAETLIQSHISIFGVACALVSVIWLLTPKGFPGKHFSLLLWLPLIFPISKSLEPGEIAFSLLDVGQGLSVVVKTKHHALVYDTGPPMGKRDAGQLILLPFLSTQGIKNLDTVMVSHPDADHIGGYWSLSSALSISETFISDPKALALPKEAIPCRQGMAWHWDGVDFEILHPTHIQAKKRNDHSCVLKISNQEHSILLTGDITKQSENTLIKTYGEALKADILVVPHHGSHSSSSQSFIKSVNPVYALVSSGYQNRYHHPHEKVLERYQYEGVSVLNTAKSGAIEFLLRPGYNISPPKRYRIDHRHFWHI